MYNGTIQDGWTHHIALVELNTTIDISKCPVICLPPLELSFDPGVKDRQGWATGWGVIDANNTSPDTLQGVTLSILNPDSTACHNLLNDVTEQICAGIPDGVQGICKVSSKL